MSFLATVIDECPYSFIRFVVAGAVESVLTVYVVHRFEGLGCTNCVSSIVDGVSGDGGVAVVAV